MTDTSAWPGKKLNASPAPATTWPGQKAAAPAKLAWPGKPVDTATRPGEVAPKAALKPLHDRPMVPAQPVSAPAPVQQEILSPEQAMSAGPADPTLREAGSEAGKIGRDIGGAIKEGAQEGFTGSLSAGQQNVREGVEAMKHPRGPGDFAVGVGKDLLGTAQEVLSPAMAVVYAALGLGQWADPAVMGMEGGEGAIKSPAIKSGDKVIEGANHPLTEMKTGLKAPQEGFTLKPLPGEGQYTLEGKTYKYKDGQWVGEAPFVGRKDAVDLAKDAGQAKPGTGAALHSEDLKGNPDKWQDPAHNADGSRAAAAGQKAVATVVDRQSGVWPGKPLNAAPVAKNAEGRPILPAKPAPTPPKVKTKITVDGKTYKLVDGKPSPKLPKSEANNVVNFISKKQKAADAFYSSLSKDSNPNKLPVDEAARVARAKEQGFDTNKTLYHGTSSEFLRFDVPKYTSEKAIFLAEDPKVADSYSHKASSPSGAKIIEIWARPGKQKVVNFGGHYSGSKMAFILEQAKKEGYDSVRIENILDQGSQGKPQVQVAFFEPGALRAKNHATFDSVVPKAKANLLSAASTPTGMLLEDNIGARKAAEALLKQPGIKDYFKAVVDGVKEFIAPETTAKGAEAAASVRKFWGQSAREAERAKAGMEKFRKLINSWDLQDRLDMLDYIQDYSNYTAKGFNPHPEIKPFLMAFRDLMKKYRVELEGLPKHDQMQFQEDFATQMWDEPKKAIAFFGTKEGSTGFTKSKRIESYAAGIRQDLIPKTTDPIAVAVLYAENAGRYIATEKIFEEAKADGNVLWRLPGRQPDGWMELNGRKSVGLERAYAPRQFATLYNRAISQKPKGISGDILEGIHRITNYSTALQLGLSGYHALNTAKEAIVSGMASGIQDLKGLKLLSAAKNIGGSLFKWLPIGHESFKNVTSLARGKAMAKMYLHDIGDPQLRKIVDLATDANFRVVGKGRAADDYRYAATNFWEAWKRGSLKADALAAAEGIGVAPWSMKAPLLAHSMIKGVGKALDTVTHPLFAYYIPMVKSGAYFDGMKSWLERNPNATIEEQRAYARKMADIIDDRFGEMNQDNIFWSKTAKMMAQSAVVSYSYEMGTLRSFGGAAADLAAAPVRAGLAMAGKPHGEIWTEKMSYVVALALTTAMISATDQYLRTGKSPESWRDLMAPQTGGEDARTGEPERVINPGYESQLATLWADPQTWLANKKNSTWSTLGELWTGKDWSGTEIALHSDSTTEVLKKYLETMVKEHSPIPAQADIKQGSKISRTERYLGPRPAGMRLTAPEEFQQMMDRKNQNEDRAAIKRDLRYKGLLQ